MPGFAKKKSAVRSLPPPYARAVNWPAVGVLPSRLTVTGLVLRASKVRWVCRLASRNGTKNWISTGFLAGGSRPPKSIRYLPAGRRILPVPPWVAMWWRFPFLLAVSKMKPPTSAGLPLRPMAEMVSG